MSIDLDWSKLDGSLASYVVDVLNRQLGNVERPSFIGPVEVTSLDFGSVSPDVELVDLRDIYRDFLEDDDDQSDRGPVKVTEGAEDEEGFEWVSRRAAGREESLAYQHLPPHIRYGRGGPTDLYASMPSIRSPIPASATSDMWKSSPNIASPGSMGSSPPLYRSPTPSTPFPAGPFRQSSSGEFARDSSTRIPGSRVPGSMRDEHESLSDSSSLGASDPLPHHHIPTPLSSEEPPQEPPPAPTPHPNLQLHFYVNWHSDIRITLTTSLLINYPSPMFMSLPIKLSVTGLVFNGEVAVAYEGERRRVHLCVLDDQDPYGPAAGKRADSSGLGFTPPDLEGDTEPPPSATHPSRSQKPLPVGQRLLPSIIIESEIGQADKHVLKNVTRVERFIQDVIRKTVEEELVFPNFHTLILGDQST